MNNIKYYLYTSFLFLSFQAIQPSEEIINAPEWRDLELFASINNTHDGLIGKFDQINTSFGKQALAATLRTPTTNVVTISKRQQAIGALLSDEKQLPGIVHHLQSLGANAESLTDAFGNKTLEQEVNKMFYFTLNKLKHLNTSALALDAHHAFQQAALLSPVADYVLFHVALEYLRGAGKGCCGHNHGHDHHTHSHQETPLGDKLINAIHVSHLVMLPFSIKELVIQRKNKINLINVIYKNVAMASTCFKAMHAINSIINQSPSLLATLEENNALAELFSSTDLQIRELIDLLLSNTFPLDSQLSFFSSVGKTLKAYHLLQKNYVAIKPALEVIGSLDALCAVTCHIKQHAGKNAGYTFVEFVERETPYVNLTQFRNPLLTTDAIVLNDFCAGDHDHQTKLVITAPNKAGKTCTIKGITLNLVWAQTYGIAAAQSCIMTPFHKILTYITINDDIAMDQSKFVASILRADKCMQTVTQLAPGEHAFAIFDDSLFEGTTHEKREAASLQFIKEIGANDNTMILVATHLPALTTLEQDFPRRFKNYTLQLTTNSNGGKQSSFTLTPGICPASSVFDVIEGQGYTVHT